MKDWARALAIFFKISTVFGGSVGGGLLLGLYLHRNQGWGEVWIWIFTFAGFAGAIVSLVRMTNRDNGNS
jgi:peptidoglycan/LPS O-acetylase OafA/YrhL